MAGLSKSKLMSFLQCPKKLWLEKRRPELALEDPGRQTLFDSGHAVGRIARDLYAPPGKGRLIDGAAGMAAAMRDTRKALTDSTVDTVFEATFQREGLLVRTDVLEKKPARLVEVKSSTAVKDEHLTDCAIQAWVLETSPAATSAIALAHINNEFVYPGGQRYEGLLTEADISQPARVRMAQVPGWLDAAQRVLSLDEPRVSIGSRCYAPYQCPFIHYCWPKVDYPLSALPGVGRKLDELIAAGYRDIRELPPERVRTAEGLRVWRAARDNAIESNGSARGELAALPWPRYYLDFETIGPAVPIWAGTRPYQAIPFQWSLHIETAAGQLEHAEFLDLGGLLPVRPLAENLLACIGTDGPVFTYTSYEKGCLKTLADFCPDLAERIQALIGRLVDLHPMVKRSYYHPAMQGSWSIKAVLPAMAPEMDYSSLDGVQDGGGAQLAYAEAIAEGTPAPRRKELEQQLLRYCGHDTLAMVKIARQLA